MDSTIADREANYKECYRRYNENPSDEKWQDLAERQLVIDDLRSGAKLSLRWYTKKELKELVGTDAAQPKVPREPVEIPETDDETVWAEKSKYLRVNSYYGVDYAITLDALLDKLQALRDKLGGDVPVFCTNEIDSAPVKNAIQQFNHVLID